MVEEINSETIKKWGLDEGAAIVGIANSKDFEDAPKGYKPTDALKGCLSVIVFAAPFSEEAILDDSVEYINVRKEMNDKLNDIAKKVSKKIKTNGYKIKIINGMGGKYIDGDQFGAISLKHAAEIAGIGVITKNYLLTNPEYGNLLWFSGILTDADLISDKKLEFDICDSCNTCVESCPTNSLDDIDSFGKKECGRKMMKMVNHKWTIDCYLCREVCPHRFGIKMEV